MQDEQPKIEVTAVMLSSCTRNQDMRVPRSLEDKLVYSLCSSFEALGSDLALREALGRQHGKRPRFRLQRCSLLFSDTEIAILRFFVRCEVVFIRVIHLESEALGYLAKHVQPM